VSVTSKTTTMTSASKSLREALTSCCRVVIQSLPPTLSKRSGSSTRRPPPAGANLTVGKIKLGFIIRTTADKWLKNQASYRAYYLDLADCQQEILGVAFGDNKWLTNMLNFCVCHWPVNDSNDFSMNFSICNTVIYRLVRQHPLDPWHLNGI
jgi:hypothetical protein